MQFNNVSAMEIYARHEDDLTANHFVGINKNGTKIWLEVTCVDVWDAPPRYKYTLANRHIDREAAERIIKGVK